MPLWYIVNPKQVTANTVNDDYGQKFLTDGDAGSGPFKIKRWDGQAVMALDAVEDYWKGWPMDAADRPAGVIYRVIREPAPRKAALQRGEVDIVTEMTPDDYDEMAKLPGIIVNSNTGMTPFTIQMNTQKGATADINFRKALAYAFDYNALLQIENNAAKLMDSPFPNAMAGHIAVPGIPRRNLDLAKQYLAKTKTPQGGIELDYSLRRRAGGRAAHRPGSAGIVAAAEHQGERGGAALAHLVARGAKAETAADMVAVYVTPVSTDPDVAAAQYASTRRGAVLGHAPPARRRTGRHDREGAAGDR